MESGDRVLPVGVHDVVHAEFRVLERDEIAGLDGRRKVDDSEVFAVEVVKANGDADLVNF